MSLDGLYSGYQFAYAPIVQNYDKTTRMHEMAHKLLTESTPWGQMLVLIREVMESDKNKDRIISYFSPICNILIQASEFTQESFAVLFSLHEARLHDDYDAIKKILESNYSKIYNKKFLDIYLKLAPAQAAFSICYRIVELAMDTYLLDIDAKHWESSETLYSFINDKRLSYFPDFRFKNFTEALSQFLKQFDSSLEKGEIESFLETLERVNLIPPEDKGNQIISVFKDLMKEIFQDDSSILETLNSLSKHIVISDLESDAALVNYFEIPRPEFNYKPFQFSKDIFSLVNMSDVLRIFPYDKQIKLVYLSNNSKKFTMFDVNWSNLESYVEVFKNEIIISCTDYEIVKKNVFYPPSRRVFYYIECHHDAFKRYLLELGSNEKPYIHFRKITESTFAIFAQIKDNDILFGFQKNYALNMFINDIFNEEYEYIQCDGSMTDNIFYLAENDDYCYGQVVQAILQNGVSGHRIVLSGNNIGGTIDK